VNCRSREHFVDMLSKFAGDSGKIVLEFPSTLNSRERYLIHEVCPLLLYLYIDFLVGTCACFNVAGLLIDREPTSLPHESVVG